MAPKEDPCGEASAAVAAAHAVSPAAAKTEAEAAATAKTEAAAAAAAAKTEAAGAAAAAAKTEAAAAAAKTEVSVKPEAPTASSAAAATAAAGTPKDGRACCSDACCSSSSSPCGTAATASTAAAAAEAAEAAAAAGEAAAAAKGSVNYAEQYMKTMGLSSSSRGYDLAAAAAARDLPSDACEEGETSGFKFPSYEEFLKEETEAQRQAETDAETTATGENAGRLDDAFSAFMTELERLPTSNPKMRRAAAEAALAGKTAGELASEKTAKVTVAAFGDAAAECVRLTSQVFVSPFQVLLLTPDATDEDIRRQYRKLSLLIHPDKCKHELAQEAFQVVNKAYEKVQEEGVKLRYAGVIEEAKQRVLKERVKENKARRAAGQELLPETMDALRGKVFEACEALLKEMQEKKEYAEKCKQANEQYEREKEDKLIEEEKEKCRERNEWVKKREERVGSWREYQEGVKKKEIEHRAFTGLRHVREERKDEDLIKKRQKVQGIDNSYKLNWR